MNDIETARAELISLIEAAGSDYKAVELIEPLCGGFPPDRSTLGKFRRGEGKPTLIAMTVALLRIAISNQLKVDRVGGSPYYIPIDVVNHGESCMELVTEQVFEIALSYRGINVADAKAKIQKAFDEDSYEVAEAQLSAYIAESGLFFHDSPDIGMYRYYLDKDTAEVVAEGVMTGSIDADSDRPRTHHNMNPIVMLTLNIIFPEDDSDEIEVEFVSGEL